MQSKEMIYITITGQSVAASRNRGTAYDSVMEMVAGQISIHIDKAEDMGDIRNTISLRTVHVELKN